MAVAEHERSWFDEFEVQFLLMLSIVTVPAFTGKAALLYVDPFLYFTNTSFAWRGMAILPVELPLQTDFQGSAELREAMFVLYPLVLDRFIAGDPVPLVKSIAAGFPREPLRLIFGE
ncbi:hypothetical protein [Vibrio sp. Evd11]|uniref:hypothetical protein n=1 Tax=Vibrio sp. Evd11 TaxID=1207404 RepID=UPI000EFBB986|nr:hypothetical protein [Vibrio sp. Evd11]